MGKFVVVALFTLAVSCGSDEPLSDYEAAVTESLDQEVERRLIYDIEVGDSRSEFFAYAREENRKQHFLGGSGMTIHTRVGDDYFERPGDLEFFPIFREDTIIGVRGTLSFDSWSPTKPETHAEAILAKTLPFFESFTPGTGFVAFEGTPRPTYFKLHANLRTAVFPRGLQEIAFETIDMRSVGPEIRSGQDLREPDDPYFEFSRALQKVKAQSGVEE